MKIILILIFSFTSFSKENAIIHLAKDKIYLVKGKFSSFEKNKIIFEIFPHSTSTISVQLKLKKPLHKDPPTNLPFEIKIKSSKNCDWSCEGELIEVVDVLDPKDNFNDFKNAIKAL